MQSSDSRPSETDPLVVTGIRHSEPNVESPGPEAPESELPVPEGELLGGRYLVERIFAEGGMGIVCHGRHTQLDQPVAIKFLRRALAGKPSVVERFLNEGRALAALRSEHVVRVMDVGQLDSGRPYLVMEHLEGLDLDALVDRDGPLAVETAVSYALQVCEPLAEAHALGIVHRDIKPENLFLWTGGPRNDLVKVLDFGLAKQFGSPRALAVTGPQDSMGSPCYMSPEQITTPQSIDLRTDIWSLGVVLHRLLTDSLPFDGGSVVEVISHVLSAAPKSLHEARPERTFDAELEVIVRRCLEKDPAARYENMNELSQALSAYLAQRVAALPSPLAAVAREGGAVGEARVVDASAADDPSVFRGADEKPQLAGLRSRWPLLLVGMGVLLAAVAVYQVGRSSFMAARLTPDASLWTVPDHFEPRLVVSRGIYAAEPTRDASGALALGAEREHEREIEGSTASAAVRAVATLPAANPPLSDAEREANEAVEREAKEAAEREAKEAAERAAKDAAYQDYLKGEGLAPIVETLQEMNAN